MEAVSRALVTRPLEEAKTLAAALVERGVEPVIEPLIEIHFRTAAALNLAGAQAVLCTSANGVRALVQVSGERGLPLFAVGDATASRARAEGFGAVESAGRDVTSLARLVAARLKPEAGRLVHVAGDVVAGDLAGALRAQGFTVDRSVLYEARPAKILSPMISGALRSGAIDWVLFFSPRTAAVFVRLTQGADLAECCGTVTALSISNAADAPLAALPWRDRWIAEQPNQLALLEMLDRVLGERARG